MEHSRTGKLVVYGFNCLRDNIVVGVLAVEPRCFAILNGRPAEQLYMCPLHTSINTANVGGNRCGSGRGTTRNTS